MESTLAVPASAGNFAQFDEGAPFLAPSPQPPHKRNRTQLSCTNCRQAKLKCDRQKPHCSQCVRKGRATLCAFPSAAARKKPTVSMQNRLKHLESLVKDVMTGQSPSGLPVTERAHYSNRKSISNHLSTSRVNLAPNHDTDAEASPSVSSGGSGQVLLGSSESTYVGATHWAAILEDVGSFTSPS